MYSYVKGKGKEAPLQAPRGPDGSRKLRFPDFMTTVQDGGKVVSLKHRPLLPTGNNPGIHFCQRSYCDGKDFISTENPLTLDGIEPATF